MLNLIINPTAGKGRARQVLLQLTAELESRRIAYRILVTSAPGSAAVLAAQAAADPECTAVLAIGGDGTASEVALGLDGTGIPMGIIPAGTGNDFIKTIHTPKDPMEALRFILSHDPRPIDLARINSRCFLNVSGLGFDVSVLEHTPKDTKLRGLLPYMIGLIRAIFAFRPIHIAWEQNGRREERDVLLMAAANGRYIGGGIPVCPSAEVNDGLLDFVMVESVPRWRIPLYLPGLMMGKILKFRITHAFRGTHLQVSCPGMKVQIDGEITTLDAADFVIHPGGLMLYW